MSFYFCVAFYGGRYSDRHKDGIVHDRNKQNQNRSNRVRGPN